MKPAKIVSTKKTGKEPDHVLESIHAIMHLVRSRQYHALRNRLGELTHMEGKLLGFFSRHPGSSLRDLVENTRRDKSQLARLIGGLKKQGLLEGEDDHYDRRSVRLRLTAKGQALHRSLRREVEKLSQIAVQDLNSGERLQLAAFLQRVQANLEEERS